MKSESREERPELEVDRSGEIHPAAAWCTLENSQPPAA